MVGGGGGGRRREREGKEREKREREWKKRRNNVSTLQTKKTRKKYIYSYYYKKPHPLTPLTLPVSNTIDPLSPAPPELLVNSTRLPLVVAVEYPEPRYTDPPADMPALAVTARSTAKPPRVGVPPTPSLVSDVRPAMSTTSPPRPTVA